MRAVYSRAEGIAEASVSPAEYEPACAPLSFSYSRLVPFWRPVIDLGSSPLAPVRLRMLEHTTRSLASPEASRWPWGLRLSLPGVRQQVIRQAGLQSFHCTDPRQLPVAAQTEGWRQIVHAMNGFADLTWPQRTVLLVTLAQLSLHGAALALAKEALPASNEITSSKILGNPDQQRFALDVARIRGIARQTEQSLSELRVLASEATNSQVRLAAAFQGVGRALRGKGDLQIAGRFVALGIESDEHRTDWVNLLIRSRFHRAIALLRLAEGNGQSAREEVARASALHQELADEPGDALDQLVTQENGRYIAELRLQLLTRSQPVDLAVAERLCLDLSSYDPTCISALVVCGDALFDAGHPAVAAPWYERAGELGTQMGAIAWFRAAQCHVDAGDEGAAANAMGRCLELDPEAHEPRVALAATQGPARSNTPTL